MNTKQKLLHLRMAIVLLESLLNESLDFHMSQIKTHQISKSYYVLELELKNKHYFESHNHQFLQFSDPLKAKAFIDALYILVTRQPSHEQGQALQFVVHSLMTSKQYLHE